MKKRISIFIDICSICKNGSFDRRIILYTCTICNQRVCGKCIKPVGDEMVCKSCNSIPNIIEMALRHKKEWDNLCLKRGEENNREKKFLIRNRKVKRSKYL